MLMGIARRLGLATGKALGFGAKTWGGMGQTARSATIGGAIGGVMGADEGVGGFLGGATAGALGGAAFGKFGAGRNLMGRGLARGRNMAAGMSLNKNATIRGGLMGRGAGYAHQALSSGGLNTFSNRHGDKVLAGLGAAAAGLIGSTAMSSNRSL